MISLYDFCNSFRPKVHFFYHGIRVRLISIHCLPDVGPHLIFVHVLDVQSWVWNGGGEGEECVESQIGEMRKDWSIS